jgi:purine-binding chemotaxis protein CheW
MIRPTDGETLLTFILAGDEYAVGILHVEEAVACGTITRVPGAPAFIRGAMNVRGRAIPVIDLARKLGFPESAITTWSCLLLTQVELAGEPTALGVLVDAVRQLIECTADHLKPPPALGTRVHPEYLRGLVSVEDRFIPLLNLQRLLSTEELLLVASATAVPAAPLPGPSSECEANIVNQSETPHDRPNAR